MGRNAIQGVSRIRVAQDEAGVQTDAESQYGKTQAATEGRYFSLYGRSSKKTCQAR